MRLYGMYYVCKQYVDTVFDMKVGSRSANGKTIRIIDDWLRKSRILNELGKVYPLREAIRELYETIPVIYRDQDKFDVDQSTVDAFIKARGKLITSMKTIINLYESINISKAEGNICGFDIKMPKFETLEEFSRCLGDLDFVIRHCPYLKKDNGDIKFGSVDIGSTWITFIVVGVAASTILLNLAKLADAAIKIKSHVSTVKMQEEALRSLELKNETAAEVLDAFKKTSRIITQNCVRELENELGELQDGEERDKVGRSLEKMGYWMDRGMQIYSTIDAPDEIKDIFPAQEEMNFLSDDIMKLLEMKNEK